jgi:putative ABC transport system substrate-binding protein
MPVRTNDEIEMGLASVGRDTGGGLIAMPDSFMIVHLSSIIALAAGNGVPAVYFDTVYAKEGGLLCYGPDIRDIFRRAAPYVDRILLGAKPADLPVQLPVKFLMAVNANSAKALGLSVPTSILLRADEVIE